MDDGRLCIALRLGRSVWGAGLRPGELENGCEVGSCLEDCLWRVESESWDFTSLDRLSFLAECGNDDYYFKHDFWLGRTC